MNLENKSADANGLPLPTGSPKAFNRTQGDRTSPSTHLPEEAVKEHF